MKTIFPTTINSVDLCSNIFFAPINPGFSQNGIFDDRYVDFFVSRAGNGVGICYVGNVALSDEWSSNNSTAVLWKNEDSRWLEISKKIVEKGSVAGIQLAWKPKELEMQKSFVNRNFDQQIAIYQSFYDKFNNFENVSQLFSESINKCEKNGFSVIQIHAAHGYGLSLLLSRSISRSLNPVETKGIKLLKKLVEKYKKHKFILDIRVSLYEGIDDTEEEFIYKVKLFKILKQIGFDMISVSNGFYNINKYMIYPHKGQIEIFDDLLKLAQKFPDIQWNGAGNLEYIICENEDLPPNLSLSLGRQLLVNPSFITKINELMFSEIEMCSECNQCHYYSYGFRGIQECKKIEKVPLPLVLHSPEQP